MNFEETVEFFKADRFVAENGITIVDASPGEATVRLDVTEHHMNAGNVLQGGAIFTLADFAFAVAANCAGELTVSSTCTISFVRAPRGKKILAHAVLRDTQGHMVFYDVRVTDADVLIATASVCGYRK